MAHLDHTPFALMKTLALAIPLMLALPAPIYAEDVPGSADIEGIGRFAGAELTYYDAKNYDAARFVTGPMHKNDDPLQAETLEGPVTRIAYSLDPSASVLEVTRNIEQKLEAEGYEIVYECADVDCGGYTFRYEAVEVLPFPKMNVDLANFRYIAAKKPGNPTQYVMTLVSAIKRATLYQHILIETGEMEDSMVDASKMEESISETGKIAIYGILFDTDSAAIKEDSRPALDEVAELMRENPELEILVVGHTDNEGSMEYNLDLSMRRAQAIVADLENKYDIAAERLAPAGAGFMSPVASNRTEAGRSDNRRVELVER